MTNRGRIAREYLSRRCISLSFSCYPPLSCVHAHARSLSLSSSVSRYLTPSHSVPLPLTRSHSLTLSRSPPLSVYRARKFELRQSAPCEISNFEVSRAAKYVRNNYLPYCVRRQCVWYSYTASPPALKHGEQEFFWSNDAYGSTNRKICEGNVRRLCMCGCARERFTPDYYASQASDRSDIRYS